MNHIHALPSDLRADYFSWHCTSCGWTSREFARSDESEEVGRLYEEHQERCPNIERDQMREAMSAAYGPADY